MAFREVRVLEVRDVLRQWLCGKGQRPISELAGMDRKTVRRYIDSAVELGPDLRASMLSLMGQFPRQWDAQQCGTRSKCSRMHRPTRGSLRRWPFPDPAGRRRSRSHSDRDRSADVGDPPVEPQPLQRQEPVVSVERSGSVVYGINDEGAGAVVMGAGDGSHERVAE